jgi:hypothetical protein
MSGASAPSSKMIDELSMPKVALNMGPYHCRAEQDSKNMGANQRMFNNSTKMQKYSRGNK